MSILKRQSGTTTRVWGLHNLYTSPRRVRDVAWGNEKCVQKFRLGGLRGRGDHSEDFGVNGGRGGKRMNVKETGLESVD